jgi:MoxR-like ATPase
MMRISLGYPSPEAEKEMLAGKPRSLMLKSLQPIISIEQLLELQSKIDSIDTSNTLIDYVYRLTEASRALDHQHGLSPRAAISLLNAAKAWAFIEGRQQVIPDDVQAVFPYICDHRMPQRGLQQASASEKILKTVDIF